MPPAAPPRTQQIVTILLLTAVLVMLITMRTRCASGTARLFETVGGPAQRVDGAPRSAPGR